jgi:CMP-N-acetylneuraminic acid synthetase
MIAVIQAKNTYAKLPNVVLQEVAGTPLLDYTLTAAEEAGLFDTVAVTTDDLRVMAYGRGRPKVVGLLRPTELSGEQVLESAVVHDAVHRLEREHQVYADIVVVLSLHSPLRRAEHIREAVDTLRLYNTDSVISVYEDYDLHYLHGRDGLTPLNPAMHRQVRLEREALYVSNGAVRALWRDVLTEQSLTGRTVGHIVMPREDSYQIKTPHDLWLIAQLLVQRRQEPDKPLQPLPAHQEEGA